ncbi:Nin1 binding protein, partial [Ascosphaera acerosa]
SRTSSTGMRLEEGEESQEPASSEPSPPSPSQSGVEDSTATKADTTSNPSDSSDPSQTSDPPETSETSDSDGEWITPSNIKQRQLADASAGADEPDPPRVMQVAVMTSDFAMQNVILQMNLNLLSTASMQRIRTLKSYILRCHACFLTIKDLALQFCPRCGKPALTRVSCTTSADGSFKLHLKRNMQWNHRGDRFSIPKAVAGSANGRVEGGGKGGWGSGLILAPDQKEYTRALRQEYWRNKKEHDLMDDDYLPGILSGQRAKGGGRVKVGAGRNVNSRKRHV